MDGVLLHLAATAELPTFAVAVAVAVRADPRCHLFRRDWEFLQYGFRAWSRSPDLKGCSGFPLSFPLVIHRSAEVAGASVLPRRSAVSSRLREPGNLPELTCFCIHVSYILFSFCQSPYWFRNRRLCLTASGWIITTGSEAGVEATGAMTTMMMVRKHLNWTKERKLMDISAVRSNIINI